ncbi:uncharacterized protein UMAG_03778 [Mycosarcoma maydis]|uniref:SUZ domain-containing protein n=1 Tax=Mycosarcoma maydis TaxID=5270 RepID=A0A0D1DVA3_MYCMD|nr:uncharacterized protein UMAG_03778 [Ustilago maydis 521]KIS68199.1 hypothetical protein UMAG_03778 [Ustilago maydis 521]|eukprot:XP_011390228.1 hypothetical protein UMAG_03778 [Ustilago maydis 521]
MTQPDALSSALAAASLHTANDVHDSSTANSTLKPVKASFASALRSDQSPSLSIVARQETACPASSAAAAPADNLVTVDDTILQAISKRDDRIFFIQYENQMAAFVLDSTRSSLELGSMNAYQRLLIHRCADQFQLQHQLDRVTHCITLAKTSSTSHPSALLSNRARQFLLHRDGVDPANVHPTIVGLAASSTSETNVSSPSSSASTPSTASPAPIPAVTSASASSATKPAFKIMHRDPSSIRRSPLRSTDNDNTDSDKTKSRKDMTLEEREASYKAARARIFGDMAISASTSPTSSTLPLDPCKDNSQIASTPSSSAASSPVVATAGRRAASRSKKPASSSSSGASHDASSQRTRSSNKNRPTPHSANDLTDDELEFSRALPITSHSALPLACAGPHQASPMDMPTHVAQGYFPPIHPTLLQQSHSNPNLRSRAPAFHPRGSTTPIYSQGGALRHPAGLETDAFPALATAPNAPAQRPAQPYTLARNAQTISSGAIPNRPQNPVTHEHYVNGIGAWAQQTSNLNNASLRGPQQQQHQVGLPYQHQLQMQQQYQPALNAYSMGQSSFSPHYVQSGQQVNAYTPSSYAGSRNSSRASSRRGAHNNSQAGGGTRDDAVSVSSISSNASSRSASFSGVSGTGSSANPTLAANGGGGSSVSSISASKPTSGSLAGLAHPSLPARPAWLVASNNSIGATAAVPTAPHASASASASASVSAAQGGEAA